MSMQLAFFSLVSMITTFAQIRFSSYISVVLSVSSTKILRCQTFVYPSLFHNRNNHYYNSQRRRISILRQQHHHQQKMTTNLMTGVFIHDKKNLTDNDDNQTNSLNIDDVRSKNRNMNGKCSLDESVKCAKMVPPTEERLRQCGERLRHGDLVAFPTETVYGLGCNALDSSAIIKVFEAKERPLTDPLITHVTENQVAFQLWAANTTKPIISSTDSPSLEGKALHALCEKFWPGPLTLVAKAAPNVPPILMADTGFVACRSPKHPISIALINAAKIPIAAPSANKFGHVSPTSSSHVWDDLQHEDVWIVKEEEDVDCQQKHLTTKGVTVNVTSCCQVGVESSVAKIEMITADNAIASNNNKKGRITLLRQGAVSLRDIQECLKEAGLANHFEMLALTKKATDETVSNVAPGQTIRHYSPDIPSFILSKSLCRSASIPSSCMSNRPITTNDDDRNFLRKSVLIDFGGKLKAWEHLSLAYQDLSETADSAEATNGVFETLRWAERIRDANQILFPEISDKMEEKECPSTGSISTSSPDALTLALKDRLTRAASGVVIDSLYTGISTERI